MLWINFGKYYSENYEEPLLISFVKFFSFTS